MRIESDTPSPEASAALDALKRAVKNTLERKRRLGQFAVVWRDGQPALLDDGVQDKPSFMEALQGMPDMGSDADFERQQDLSSEVAESKGDYQPKDE